MEEYIKVALHNTKVVQKMKELTNEEAAEIFVKTMLAIANTIKTNKNEILKIILQKVNKNFNVNFNLQTIKNIQKQIKAEELQNLQQKNL